VLAAWCVSQHKLENIAQSLRLPLVIAYAISTGNYRIDDSVLTGRTGKALDPVRTNAFFPLSMMGKSNDIPLLASLTERVLYGTGPLPLDLSFSPGAPTAEELTANYDLAAAKALSVHPSASGTLCIISWASNTRTSLFEKISCIFS
jgi:hypothetical protein